MTWRRKWTARISVVISLLFATWIVTMLVAQTSVPEQKVEAKEPKTPKEKTPNEKSNPIPTALTLPPPPAPTPTLKSGPVEVTEVKPEDRQKGKDQKLPGKQTSKQKPTNTHRPKPKPAVKANDQAKIMPKPKEPTTFVPAATDMMEGRTLLRTLEHGKGPMIEIAWPDDRSQHGRLFKHMESCLGMRVALMDGQSRLFVADGAPGSSWNINMDRYSGFLRQPAGWLSPSEHNAEYAIRKHHSMKSQASGVRIFLRQVDASLLGGLRKYIGDGYDQTKSIRARYRLEGNTVIVEDLLVDGRPIPGRIGLKAQTSRCAWRT
ncbi:MAG: hypothetical protein OQK24_02825 [Magnetovibrio sp.]|nr:hypothetical protein [Magnetovibrio sp.]